MAIQQVLLMGGAAASSIVYSTWNPADKDVSVTLSNGNLTAAQTPGYNANTVHAKTGRSAGKFYIEQKVEGALATIGTSQVGMGWAKSTFNKANNLYGQPDCLAVWWSDGNCYDVTGAVVATQALDISKPGWLCWAIDLSAGKLWIRQSGTAWIGGGDPALGTSPTLTFPTGATWMPACSPWVQTVTLNAGASAYSDVPPAGFGNWTV